MSGICGLVTNQQNVPVNVAIKAMITKLNPTGELEKYNSLVSNKLVYEDSLSDKIQGCFATSNNKDSRTIEEGGGVYLDGTIYNLDNLQQKYAIRQEDAEAILFELYKKLGLDFIKELNGEFALAIVDTKKNRVYLSRDRGGTKSLFFHSVQNKLIFASSIRAILVSKYYKVEVDWDGIWNNIGFPAPPQPLTTFKGIAAVEPASIVGIDIDSFEIQNQKYWRIPIENMTTNPDMSLEESGELIDEAFQKSIKRRCKGDNIGTLISGGVDSPYVAASAAMHIPNIKAITFGMSDKEFLAGNEDEKAGLTAKKYNMNHIVELFPIRELVPSIDSMVDIYEQPGASFASNLFLARIAKNHGLDIVLSGLAGDEQHGGFHYFKFIQLWKLVKSIPLSTFLIPRGKRKKWEDLKNLSLANTIDEYYTHAFSDFKEFEKLKMLPNLNFNSYETIRKLYPLNNGVKFNDDIQGLLYYMFSNVQNHHLYRFDQFTKHFGIEARYPFLDNDCIEAAFKIPSKFKVQNGDRKVALKQASKKWIAQQSLQKKKIGLIMPMYYLVNVELKDFVYEVLQSLKKRDGFNPRYIDHVYDTYKEVIPGKIWKLVMLELWFQKFIDADYQ